MIITLQPSLPLQQYVTGYLYFRGSIEALSMQCIPRGTPALACLLEVTSNYNLSIEYNQKVSCSNLTDLYLFAQYSESWIHKMKGVKEFLLVVLKSNALSLIIRDRSNLVTNDFVSLVHWYPDSKFVVEHMSECVGIQSKIEVLERFLIKVFKAPSKKKSILSEKCLNTIISSKGLYKIGEISKQENVSIRSIQRIFNEEIGLSPKEFSRIIRFRKMVESLYESPGINLFDLAFNFNYTDPSHLLKDFKNFTGLTPTNFIMKDKILNKKILTSI